MTFGADGSVAAGRADRIDDRTVLSWSGPIASDVEPLSRGTDGHGRPRPHPRARRFHPAASIPSQQHGLGSRSHRRHSDA
jgi:hypothetical protein